MFGQHFAEIKPSVTSVVGRPVGDDKAGMMAEAGREHGGDVVEGLEGGQELVSSLLRSIVRYRGASSPLAHLLCIVDGLRQVLLSSGRALGRQLPGHRVVCQGRRLRCCLLSPTVWRSLGCCRARGSCPQCCPPPGLSRRTAGGVAAPRPRLPAWALGEICHLLLLSFCLSVLRKSGRLNVWNYCSAAPASEPWQKLTPVTESKFL